MISMFAKNMFTRMQPRAGMKFVRHSSNSIPHQLYQNVWKKSNVFYITYIVAGCVIGEAIYGSVTNFIWDSVNYGKLYHQIDWSSFKSEDDEEEEEEEDDE